MVRLARRCSSGREAYMPKTASPAIIARRRPDRFCPGHSPESGFLGAPAAEKIPEFCGRCHPGVLADYRGSAHGAALGAGGPQCVTCHGNHAVRKATLELINRRDCGRCHSYDRAEEIRAAMEATDSGISGTAGRPCRVAPPRIVTKALEGISFPPATVFIAFFIPSMSRKCGWRRQLSRGN